MQLIDTTQWFKPLRKTSARRTANFRPTTSGASAAPSRLRGDARVSLPRRLRLLEGDGRAAAAPAQSASLKAIELPRCTPVTKTCALLYESSATTCSQFAKMSSALDKRLPSGGDEDGRRRRGRQHKEGTARKKNCSTPGHGSATAAWSSSHEAVRRWRHPSRTTTSSAIAWMPRSRRSTSLAAADLKRSSRPELARRDRAAVIARCTGPQAKADPLRGLFAATVKRQARHRRYEPDSACDTSKCRC